MSEQAQQRTLTHALNVILREQAGAQHYHEKQRQARSGGAGNTGGARPLEFDESGFPIRQDSSGVIQRVARLLYPR